MCACRCVGLARHDKEARSAIRAAGRQAPKQPRFVGDINVVDSTTIKFGAAGFYQSPTLTASSTGAIYVTLGYSDEPPPKECWAQEPSLNSLLRAIDAADEGAHIKDIAAAAKDLYAECACAVQAEREDDRTFLSWLKQQQHEAGDQQPVTECWCPHLYFI